MSKSQNLLSTVTPWEMVAQGYAKTTMKFFRSYTEKALSIAGLNKDSVILDVACGPGTLPLLAANRVKSIHAIDFSLAMLQLFKKEVQARALKHIDICNGDGQHLPFCDQRFDVVFSMFGLMFFPNRSQGYSEIYRTLKPGGKIILSSWAPVSESTAMQTMFGAIKAIKPDLPEPRVNLESLENPEFFKSELHAAGFMDVDVHPVLGEYPVHDVNEFWSDMVKGSAPIVMLKNSMSADEWIAKERVALEFLRGQLLSLPTTLHSLAWLACGYKPELHTK